MITTVNPHMSCGGYVNFRTIDLMPEQPATKVQMQNLLFIQRFQQRIFFLLRSFHLVFNSTLGAAKAGGEQRRRCWSRRRSTVARGRGGRGSGGWRRGRGELADEGGEGLRVGAAVAERHEQRQGVAVEAGVKDLGHLERQL